MDSTQLIAISGLVLSVVGTVYTAINHKRIRSNCCGHDIVASIDVESTTPPHPIRIPAPTTGDVKE